MKAIITVGVSGSGKSTFAKELCESDVTFAEVNRDNIREELFGDNYKQTKEKELTVSGHQQSRLGWFWENNYNVIISDTNLNPTYRQGLVSYLEGLGYEVEIKNTYTDYEKAWKQNENRVKNVPLKVFNRQWKMWIEYLKSIGEHYHYVPNQDLEQVYVVDIDGTIARMNGRNPYEFDKVGTDLPRKEIIKILEILAFQARSKIIFLSGRDDSCYSETVDWIKRVFRGDNFFELYMRKTGDKRKDSIVKQEIFEKEIASKYNVQMVIDDRPQVVRMWYDIGIENVLCVADSREEF